MVGTRAVLLDVFETVLSVDFKVVHRNLALKSGIDEGHWWSVFGVHADSVMSGAMTLGEAYTIAGVPHDEIEALLAHEAALMMEHVTLHPDTIPFMQEVRRRGISIAFVSNCAANAGSLLEALALDLHADHLVLSCHAGSIKPEPDIYRMALDALDVDPAEAVFVDDQPGYCAGAEALGIRAIQISRGTPAPGAVSSLTDVLTLL